MNSLKITYTAVSFLVMFTSIPFAVIIVIFLTWVRDVNTVIFIISEPVVINVIIAFITEPITVIIQLFRIVLSYTVIYVIIDAVFVLVFVAGTEIS